jgi:cystathionine beta-lyase
MKYNFDDIVPRRNTNSVKWESASDPDVIPMWVADMDFRTAEPIVEALQQKVQGGIFGYTSLPDAYYEAVVRWWKKRHQFEIQRDWILFCTGVIPALSSVIRTFTEPGDKILVQSPVYNIFYNLIRNNGREVIVNELVYKDGKYEIDFADLNSRTADPKVKAMLLCNPHNPVGRVWTREELSRIGEICVKHGVAIVADEIHCDLVYPGRRYVPFASVNEKLLMNSITCTSPTKTFNLAGLHVSNVIVPNDEWRSKLNRSLNNNEVAEPNAFAVEALIAAYESGEEWLEQLLDYLNGNLEYLMAFMAEHLPSVKPIMPEATYLIWIDCRRLGISSRALQQKMLNEGKLWLNDGLMYGENGEGFIRINIACPRERLIDGLNRFKNVVGMLLKE